jgi:Mg2+ and Co2+ transporter CorA
MSESQLFFGFLVIGCALQNLASLSPSLFRLAYPYITFYLVYLPNVFDAKSNNDLARTMKIITMMGVIVFALYANRHLVFTFS